MMKARWEKGKKENEKGGEEKERRENKKRREKLLESKKTVSRKGRQEKNSNHILHIRITLITHYYYL